MNNNKKNHFQLGIVLFHSWDCTHSNAHTKYHHPIYYSLSSFQNKKDYLTLFLIGGIERIENVKNKTSWSNDTEHDNIVNSELRGFFIFSAG